jgi:hypothetical protein
MQFADGKRAEWDEGLAANPDPYGRQCFEFAERWANLMEAAMSEGKRMEDIAEETSHRADTSGITGFMYGVAVRILANAWSHGEALRRWHNRQYMPEEKAAEADKSGGVVNPAILTIG